MRGLNSSGTPKIENELYTHGLKKHSDRMIGTKGSSLKNLLAAGNEVYVLG